MMTEDSVEEGEVEVVMPEQAVHIDEIYPGAKSQHGSGAFVHRFEIIAACVMGLSTISGGILEGYTSTSLPTLLQPDDIFTNASDIVYMNTASADLNDSLSGLNTSSTIESTTEEDFHQRNSTNFYLNEEQASWLGSLLLLGACLGAMVSSWVVSLGRRRAVLASALPRIIGWIMIAAASDVYMMYGGRFLAGVSLGVVTSAAPVYISEVSHSSVRGALSCVVQLGVNFGIFIAALLGSFIAWRGLAIVGAVTVVIYFIATLFIPNSPVWLVECGQEDAARTALRKLRGPDYCVEFELQQIISTKASQYNAYSWRDVLRLRVCLVPLGVVGLVTMVNRCSGYNAIITFCATFLHEAVPSFSQRWAAAAVTLMQVVSTAGAVVLVDRLGRRKLLIASITAMGIALITIAISDIASSHGAGGSLVAFIAAIVYVSAYSMGVGPVTWVLLGEMFPQAARDKAAAIISVLNWFLAFVITKTYFGLESVVGISGTCFVYGAVCAIGLVLVYLLVPETKGRSLGEIEAHFTYAQHPWSRNSRSKDVALSSILSEHDGGGIGGIESYSTFPSAS